jgi:hypothetical protein
VIVNVPIVVSETGTGLKSTVAGLQEVQREQKKTQAGFKNVTDSATTSAGKMADSIGKVSTTLARSATAFGLPIQALRTLDDVADVAEIGLKNLTSASITTRSAMIAMAGPIIAVAAAGFALGTLIGTLLDKFQAVRDFADRATRGLYDFLAAHKLFGMETSRDAGAGAFQGLKEWQAAMKASNQGALKQQVQNLKEMGLSAKEIAQEMKHLTPEMKTQLGLSEKQLKLQQERTQAVEKEIERAKDLALAYREAAKDFAAVTGRLGDSFLSGAKFSSIDQLMKGARGADVGGANLSEVGALTAWEEKYGKINAEAAQVQAKTRGIVSATIDWHQQLSTIADLAQAMGGTFGKVFGSIAGGVAGIGSLLQRNDKGDNALSGFSRGGFGGIVSGLAGSFAIGGAALGIGKAIVSLFKGDPVKKAQKEVGKVLGEGISRELAETLLAEAKRSGKSLGQVAKEYQTQMKAAKEAERQQNVTEGLGRAQEALRAFPWADPKFAAAAAGAFSSVFWASVKEKGIAAATEAMRPAWEQLLKTFSEAGLDPSALGGIGRLMELAANPAFAAASQAVSSMSGIVGGMRQAGFVDRGLTGSGGAVAQQALASAVAAGASPREAFMLIAPLLTELVNASKASGQVLDENTTALLAEAKVNGIDIIADPMIESVAVQKEIRDILKAGGGAFAPSVFEGDQFTSARGFGPRRLTRDSVFQAHAGEHVMIIPRGHRYRTAIRGYYEEGGFQTPAERAEERREAAAAETAAATGTAAASATNAQIAETVAAAVKATSPTPITVQYAPQTQIVDQSAVKTAEGQRAFGRFMESEFERMLDQNARGLVSKIEKIVRRVNAA